MIPALKIRDLNLSASETYSFLWEEAQKYNKLFWKKAIIFQVAEICVALGLNDWTDEDLQLTEVYIARRFSEMVKEGCFKYQSSSDMYERIRPPLSVRVNTSTGSDTQLDSAQLAFPVSLQLALPLSDSGIELPPQSFMPAPRVETLVSRIIRDTPAAKALKDLYDGHCQVCGLTLQIEGRNYCEVHHLRPLGHPHDGPDDQSNMLCLCPNHHALFDYFVPLWQEENTIKIGEESFTLVTRHTIAQTHIDYYREQMQQAKQDMAILSGEI